MSSNPTATTAAEDVALAGAMRRGTLWVLLGHLASQLIGLCTLAILYRWLLPADYGILGTVLPAVMLPRMAATLGPGIAVMQRRELSPTQLSVLFWLQLAVGIVAAALTITGIGARVEWAELNGGESRVNARGLRWGFTVR